MRTRAYALPTFLWATGGDAAAGLPAAAAGRRLTAAEAARAHLGRVAPFYRLDRDDVREAALRNVHDTGRGGVIATFRQVIDGVEVFRDEMKFMMDRRQGLVAVAGSLPSRALLERGPARTFRLSDAEATARALADFTGRPVAAGQLRPVGEAGGGFRQYAASTPLEGLDSEQPLRVKKVWFHLPDALVPAYYVEVVRRASNADSYVIAARDGEILFRKDLIASDAFTYRVWADAAAPHVPWDGPQGNAPTPASDRATRTSYPAVPGAGPRHAAERADLDQRSLAGAGRHRDAWATTSTPTPTSARPTASPRATCAPRRRRPGTFDRTYDVLPAPRARRAAAGVASPSCSSSTTGCTTGSTTPASTRRRATRRPTTTAAAGSSNDRLLAEAQDYGGTNNANMSTPADGARPRMQMYVFNRGDGRLLVNSPAAIAGAVPGGRRDVRRAGVRPEPARW